MLQYNSKSDNYETIVDGKLVEIDSDVFAEELAAMQKDGMSWEEAMDELSRVSTWTGSTPMDGVYVDGVEQK